MLTSDSFFEKISKPKITEIKCIIFDYDGTLTTLRRGWSIILKDYAREKINPYNKPCSLIEEKILELTTHAGGTTPKQLIRRLVKIIDELNHLPKDEILSVDEYAKDYLSYFQEKIDHRLQNFSSSSESYVIKDVRPMLDFVQQKNTINYLVTGSCAKAVNNELNHLKMAHYFHKIYGATLEMEGNLKLDAMNEILKNHNLKNSEVLVIGDGSTEVAAAQQLGLPILGIASNEHEGGICQTKYKMLRNLGAHAIITDYSGFENVWNWFNE